MLSDLFAFEGWRAVCLGADVPRAALMRGVAHFAPQLVVQLSALREVVGTLRADGGPGLRVMVGGPAFADGPDLWRAVGADGFAPALGEAVERGASLVGGVRARRRLCDAGGRLLLPPRSRPPTRRGPPMPRRPTVALCGLALALAACSALPGAQPAAPGAASRLSDILDRGRLRVATPADLPPLSMRNRAGEVVGFEIDLAKALAEAMDLEVEIVVTPFPELISTLERGEVDLVLGGLTMTPERNARVAFAGPYFISGTSLVTRNMDAEDLRDPARLDDPSRAFAALADSTSADFVRETFPRARLVLTRDYAEAVDKLIAGEVDAVVADFLACKLAEWRHRDEGLQALHMPFTTEPLGIALPAGEPLLLNLVENYLNTLEDTGELTLLKARWLSDGAWLDELP